MRSVRWQSRGVAATLSVALLAPLAQAQRPSLDSLAKLRMVATYAFAARVDSLNASTVSSIPASANTIAVTPTKQLQCPYEVGPTHLEPVTVYTRNQSGLARGQIWWFFATGWWVGEGLAVNEVARVSFDSLFVLDYLGPRPGLAAPFFDRHLTDTVAVVTGTLSLGAARSVLRQRGSAVLGRWTTVTLRVRGVLKGPAADTLVVAIPFAGLRNWTRLQAAADGHRLFLLHSATTQPNLIRGKEFSEFVIRSEDDIRPAADSASVVTDLKQLAKISTRAPAPTPRCGTTW